MLFYEPSMRPFDELKYILVKKIFSLLVVLMISLLVVKGQNTGQWNEYLSTTNARYVTCSDTRIYCSTDGGLYFYNKTDNSIEKITRSNGLSDAGVNIVKYSKQNKVLLIAYQNSNVDLYFDESKEMYNISDIKRKDISGDKSIYNITFEDNAAYLSCGFGIVAINLERREIKDTYIIGDNGENLTVFDIALKDTWIYAATQEGIKRAKYQEANLLDYNVWEKMADFPRNNQKVKNIVSYNNEIVANYSTGSTTGEEFYAWNGSEWRRVLNDLGFAHSLNVHDQELLIAANGASYIYNTNYSRSAITSYQFYGSGTGTIDPREIIKDNEGLIWIADNSNGLIKTNEEDFEQVSPSGPADNMIFKLAVNGDDLWIAKGGIKADWNNSNLEAQFQLKRDNEWEKWDKSNVEAFNTVVNIWNGMVRDIVNIAVDPNDPDHVFLASWGSGIFEFQNGEMKNWFFKDNSPLENVLTHSDYVRCMGLDFDKTGNLYITCSEVDHNLHRLSPDGEWESYELDASADDAFIGDVKVLKDGTIWMLDRRDGLVIMNSNDTTQKKKLSVEALFTNAEVEKITNMDDVYSFAEDHEGALWVGTSKGIAVYITPSRVFQQDILYAYQPGLDLNDGLYHPLLEKEVVTAIAVDGANRKWCGTKGSGVYLISENGEEELIHFTAENSPLLSDQINDIAINSKTGEVYFGTSAGLVSYMGDAIDPVGSFNNVYVYPNPVRETYQGEIIIKGLKENTDIKITDIAGNLVYETTSLGGQSVWDGRTQRGNRASTGVYLVLGADESRTETFITKILFIH